MRSRIVFWRDGQQICGPRSTLEKGLLRLCPEDLMKISMRCLLKLDLVVLLVSVRMGIDFHS